MGRKSMAGKSSRTCTVGAKIKKYIYNFFKFKFETALNGYLDKFVTWIILRLPKEVLNALLKIYTIYNRNELLKDPVRKKCLRPQQHESGYGETEYFIFAST